MKKPITFSKMKKPIFKRIVGFKILFSIYSLPLIISLLLNIFSNNNFSNNNLFVDAAVASVSFGDLDPRVGVIGGASVSWTDSTPDVSHANYMLIIAPACCSMPGDAAGFIWTSGKQAAISAISVPLNTAIGNIYVASLDVSDNYLNFGTLTYGSAQELTWFTN